jgi:steroid delta-isomerase-like uncharacterized protein
MSSAMNTRQVLRFYEEIWNQGNLDVADEVFAEDYVRHDLRPTDALPGPAGQKRIAADLRAAFPDLHMQVDVVLADGDLVAARWTTSGTHLGRWGSVEATGRRVRFSGVNIFRFQDGRVAELWNHRDDLGTMEQLGAPVFAGSAPE